MSADRYEIDEIYPGVVGVRLGANTWYLDDDQPEARAIRQQSRDIELLRAELAAAVAERDDYRDEFSGLCRTLSVGSEGRPEMAASDWRKRVDEGIEYLLRPLIAQRDALRVRLAAIDAAPTVAVVSDVRTQSDRYLIPAELTPRGRLPIGTELIARPAKEGM